MPVPEAENLGSTLDLMLTFFMWQIKYGHKYFGAHPIKRWGLCPFLRNLSEDSGTVLTNKIWQK